MKCPRCGAKHTTRDHRDDLRCWACWAPIHPNKPLCRICGRQLDNPSDPTTENCGGDCLRCMAEVGNDPDCRKRMYELTDDPKYRGAP